MKKLLITGFQPFGGADTNPSWLAVQALPDVVGEYELCKLEIPVVFGEAADLVLAKAKEIQADLVIAVDVDKLPAAEGGIIEAPLIVEGVGGRPSERTLRIVIER